MKSGKQIAYLGVDKSGKAVSIPLPLDRFAEAFDGPPVPLDKYWTEQKKIAGLITKRLTEMGAAPEAIAARRAEAGQAPPTVSQASSQAFANIGKNPVVNTGWYKICTEVSLPQQQNKTGDVNAQGKRTNVCLTQVDIRDEDSMVLAGKIVARKVDGRASWEVLVMLPLGTSLPEGATVTIDNAERIKLVFISCDTTACYAQANISTAILDQLKNGHEVSYTGTDESGDTLLVPVSLSGFKEAFDGAAMPMEVYTAEMRRIAETILVRAARRRKEQRH